MSEIQTIGGDQVEGKVQEADIHLRLPSGLAGQTKDWDTTKNSERNMKYAQEDRLYEQETKLLRHRLKVYFYAAVKYKDHICSFQAIYFIFMLLQMLKVGLITAQMFSFGDDRVDFNNVVHRGHLTLRHLLLEGWDASWETLPYPPAQGDFAVYDIDELKEKINYAVTNLYNAPADAIGYFMVLDPDNVTADMAYFDFGGFHNTTTSSGLEIKRTSFRVIVDEVPDNKTAENRSFTAESTSPTADNVTSTADNKTTTDDNTTVTVSTASVTTSHPTTTATSTSTDKHYKYDVDKDFERNKLSDPIKRLLTITITFRIYSVRVDIDSKKARCLSVNGWIHFKDPDNNGQVIQDLETLTTRIKCAELNFDVKGRR